MEPINEPKTIKMIFAQFYYNWRLVRVVSTLLKVWNLYHSPPVRVATTRTQRNLLFVMIFGCDDQIVVMFLIMNKSCTPWLCFTDPTLRPTALKDSCTFFTDPRTNITKKFWLLMKQWKTDWTFARDVLYITVLHWAKSLTWGCQVWWTSPLEVWIYPRVIQQLEKGFIFISVKQFHWIHTLHITFTAWLIWTMTNNHTHQSRIHSAISLYVQNENYIP